MRHVPRRRFGQHFLADRAVIGAIIDAVAPRPGDAMVEIGPGLGALTQPLSERLERLHVVEIDRDIVARLRSQYADGPVVVHEGDALKFDFAALGPNLRVVGNLPYNISTPLLFRLADCAAGIRDIHVMLQREIVARMVAPPSGPEYGRLSVMLQYRFEMASLMEVPPGAFRPPPRVHSAVVRMVPLSPLPHPARDERAFARVVRAAFAHRRKTLRNALKGHFSAGELIRLGVDGGLRAQDLGVADFVRLADAAAAA